MSKFSIRNITAGGVTLPLPYNVILPPGKAIVVADTEANILANLGGPNSVLGVVRVEELASSTIVTPLPVGPDDVPATFVYRPGATGVDAPGGNVYTDWALLMAAIDATKYLGQRVIEFDSTVTEPAPIPAGVWNMTGVKWVGVPRLGLTQVEILDGASFVMDPINVDARALMIEGYGFIIYYNGVGPVTPFDGVDILCGGNNVRFANTNPLAKPMFRSQGFNIILFSGECVNGGIQNYPDPTLAAPVIDTNGGGIFIFGGGGVIANGFATDLSGGPGGAVFCATFNNFYGDYNGGFYDQWSAPDLIAAGGVIFFDENRSSVRYRVNPQFAGVPVTAGPYAAAYNEFVPVDTTLGPVTVNLPKAGIGGVTNASYGERVTIKDVGLSLTPPGTGAATNPITIASTYGDTIDGTGVINTDGGSMTFVCWGYGIWSQV